MKYTTKLSCDQRIKLDGQNVIIISSEGGRLPDELANAAAQTRWGKRLIEMGLLSFTPETSDKRRSASKDADEKEGTSSR
jgi:hypothetical protein